MNISEHNTLHLREQIALGVKLCLQFPINGPLRSKVVYATNPVNRMLKEILLGDGLC